MQLILFIFLLILIGLYFLPLRIMVKYSYRGDKSRIFLQVNVLRLFTIPVLTGDSGRLLKNKRKVKKASKKINYRKMYGKLKLLKKLKPRWQYLKFDLNLGTGDPAVTAVSYGIIWSIIGVILTSFSVEETDIRVEPDLENIFLSVDFESIISLFLGNIIVTGLLIIKEEILHG